MIDFDAILPPHRVKRIRDRLSKKTALETAAELLSSTSEQLTERSILEALLKREQLGSTALEDSGVAIPHCRHELCTSPIGCLMLMRYPVDFDGAQVRICYAMVVPSSNPEQHVHILGVLAKVFMETSNVAELQKTKSDSELHALISNQLALAMT